MKNIVWIFIAVNLLFFHTRGLFYSDDGYILNSALRVLHGQIPYKDFHFAYTPVSIFIELFSFKLFGVSILSSRIVAAAISFLTCLIIFKLSSHITKKRIEQFAPIFIYVAWIPTHSNFIFPTPLAITTGLLTCLFVLSKKYFWAGVFTAITFLCKQNFGAVLFLNSLFILFIPKLNKQEFIKQYSKGLLVVCSLFVAYLIGTNSLVDFLNDFRTYTFSRIVEQQTLSTSFFYGFSFLSIAKLLFYLSPLLISASAFIFSFKHNRKFIFLATFVILFYIIGIRPTTDYIHLTPLLSLTGVPLLILSDAKQKIVRQLIILTSCSIILMGFYTGLFFNYYRWNPRLLENNYFVQNPRIRIFAFDDKLSQTSKLIENVTKPEDYVFIDSYNPIYYFVADRQNPTKFDLLEGGLFYHKYKSELVTDINRHRTKLIIADPDKNIAFLGKDILQGYELKQSYYGLGFFDKINK